MGTGIMTWHIYQNCVQPVALNNGAFVFPMTDRITTGSLFATFGSAIIAVFTLYTSRYLSGFQKSLVILTQELAGRDGGMPVRLRRPFMPRVSRTRTSGEDQFFGVESAQIHFQIGANSQIFSFPTTETEFKELPILLDYLRMKWLRGRYLSSLRSPEQISEYPAWDCVMSIYRNVVLYKASYFFVWTGVCFVLQSILFTFFYADFYHLFEIFH